MWLSSNRWHLWRRIEALLCGVLAEAVFEGGAALAHFGVGDGHADCFVGADDAHELFSAGDGGVEQIALEHFEVLGGHEDDDGRILAAL